MSFKKTEFRESIIPDIQVKLRSLCLDDDENGIVIEMNDDFSAEQRLIDMEIQKLTVNGVVPIKMRKYLFYIHSKAG